jgi:hypothetical protein
MHRTTELSDSRPAVIRPVTLDNQSAPPKPGTLELRSGAAVRSSDFVELSRCAAKCARPSVHGLHRRAASCGEYG